MGRAADDVDVALAGSPMSRREYPRIGDLCVRRNWTKAPTKAPRCIAPGCECRAVCQPWIEVSWFRGEDERSGPVCKEHSRHPPAQLLAWAEAWKAENRRKNEEAIRRKQAKAAPKDPAARHQLEEGSSREQ